MDIVHSHRRKKREGAVTRADALNRSFTVICSSSAEMLNTKQRKTWMTQIVLLLEQGMCVLCDVSQVLVVTCNLADSACLVEATVLHVYKMEGHLLFHKIH